MATEYITDDIYHIMLTVCVFKKVIKVLFVECLKQAFDSKLMTVVLIICICTLHFFQYQFTQWLSTDELEHANQRVLNPMFMINFLSALAKYLYFSCIFPQYLAQKYSLAHSLILYLWW